MSRLRPLLRRAAYRSGALSLRRRQVRQALTAVMLHRVMDPADADFALADPVYTVSTPLFAQLLQFFRDHYFVVDLQQVLDAIDGTRALPRHALLITFDDGWADNLRYAAPMLAEHKMPAVIFVAAEAVQDTATAWWQEEVFACGRTGLLAAWIGETPERERLLGDGADVLDVVTRLALMDAPTRDRVLASLPRQRYQSRMMMDEGGLRRLSAFGIEVALHGYRHIPLTAAPDVRDELMRTSIALERMTAGKAVTSALGCPHGRYDERAVSAARDVGVKAIFTSDKTLNACEDGLLSRERTLGRISIDEKHVMASPYRLDTSAAARWLWARELG